MSKDWQSIIGWLSDAEGSALRRLAAGKTVLELGSWQGRSSVAIAQVAERLTCVDTFQGDAETGRLATLDIFRANLDRFGVADRVEVHVGDIAAIGPTLPDRAFDLVFIDSAHDAASAERDARLALRVVKPGGVVAWHDSQYITVQHGLISAGLDARHPDYLADTLGWFVIPNEEKS